MNQTHIKEIVKISVKNIILNFVLASLKILAGLLSNSLAVFSDGLNSLSDVATTVTVLISSHFSKMPRDKEHQYGHEKIESVVSMMIALFLGIIALYTIYESFLRIISKQSISLSYLALGATLLSAGVKYYMYRSTKRAAKVLESDSLGLVAVDFRFDVLLSCSVFVGIFFAMIGMWFFEPIAAIAASIFLLISAYGFVTKAFNQLVDKAADDVVTEMIKGAALSCDGVINVDLLMTRLHGNAIYVDIEISVDSNITVYDGHLIAENVHDKLENELECKIKHCNVHVNPYLEEISR